MTTPGPVQIPYGSAASIRRRRTYSALAILTGIIAAAVALLPVMFGTIRFPFMRSWGVAAIPATVSLLAITTIVFVTLALLKPVPHRFNRFSACLALFLAATSTGGAWILPSLNRTRCGGPIESCSSSLRQIGSACLLYANDHHNQYPPNLETLLLGGYLDSPSPLLCVTDPQSPAPGATPAQQVAALANGAHCSYIYTGAGQTSAGSPEIVVAYERIPNGHTSPPGFNVLFNDGHCEFLSPASAPWLLDELASGHNPPRSETHASYGR